MSGNGVMVSDNIVLSILDSQVQALDKIPEKKIVYVDFWTFITNLFKFVLVFSLAFSV